MAPSDGARGGHPCKEGRVMTNSELRATGRLRIGRAVLVSKRAVRARIEGMTHRPCGDDASARGGSTK
jgi:hypothetical protein